MPITNTKFSQFVDGGNLAVNDTLVGLRGGVNTKFLYTGALPPGVIVPMSQGGTGANLTPALGAIPYSAATEMALLAPTATANQMFQSGANAAPHWSTATWPVTTTINQLLFSSAANTVSGVTASNSSMLVSSLTGVPTWLGPATNGQIVIGSTGAIPVLATLTAGSGVSILNAAGSITISATTGGLSWTTIAGTTQAAAVNSGYVSGNAAQTTVTLPSTAAVGDVVQLEGLGAAGWILAANTGQTIKIGPSTTSSAGSLTSAAASDNVRVVCIVANTTWRVTTTNSTGLTVA